MKRISSLLIGLVILLVIAGCSGGDQADVTLYMMTQEDVAEDDLNRLEQWVIDKIGDRFSFEVAAAPEYNKDKLTIEVGIGKYELIILPEADYEEYVHQNVFEALDDYVSIKPFQEGIRTIEVRGRVPGTGQRYTQTYTSLYGIPMEKTVMEQELDLFDESLYMVIIPRLEPPIERVQTLQLIAEGKITSDE